MTLPPPLPLPLPPPLPAFTVLPPGKQVGKWKLDKLGYDKLQLQCSATLTRAECFRLIGELERMAGEL